MSLRTAFIALAFCFVSAQLRANTFQWSFTDTCYACGPFVNQQGVPVNNGGVPANLFVDAGGTLTTTDTLVNGALTITGIKCARVTNCTIVGYLDPAITEPITGLIPPDPGYPLHLVTPNDNLLYPNQNSVLDSYGFAFTVYYGYSIADQIACPYPGSCIELGPLNLSGQNTSFTLTAAAATPEPSTFVLFGMAGFVAVLYRFRCAR